jgi:molecular chaperone GrpE
MAEQDSKERKINVEDESTEKDNATCDNQDACTDDSPKADDTSANAGEEQAEAADAETKDEPTDPLAEAQQQLAELKDRFLRTVAEFENYKKRTMKEKAELILNGGEKTVSAILPVLDDFERAMADNSDDPKAIKEGVQMIFNKFVKTLEGLGVKKIETEGAEFNTDYHEAIALVPGMGDDKKGKVIDCVQTGYTINDKVIRHAKVAVGQ